MRNRNIARTMLLTGGNGGTANRRDDTRMGGNDSPARMERGYDMPESRFRDRTGREHYDNGQFAPMRNSMGGYDGYPIRNGYDDSPSMRGDSDMYAGRYDSPMQYDDNVIGFAPREERTRMHSGRRETSEVSQGYAAGHTSFTPETAMEWARGLHNPDGSTGPKWSREQLKPYMQQVGYQGDDMTFYAVANMLYGNASKVLKKYGIDRPEVYADLAKAWIEDKDAVPDKAGMYYRYIVAKR